MHITTHKTVTALKHFNQISAPTENGTFQDNASKLFNNLPETIRNCKDYRTFLRLSRNFLRNKKQTKRLGSFTVIGFR